MNFGYSVSYLTGPSVGMVLNCFRCLSSTSIFCLPLLSSFLVTHVAISRTLDLSSPWSPETVKPDVSRRPQAHVFFDSSVSSAAPVLVAAESIANHTSERLDNPDGTDGIKDETLYR